MTVTKSVKNDTLSTQENLVQWALDNGYSPVTSYTMVPVANRFHLRLENSNGTCGVLSLGRSVSVKDTHVHVMVTGFLPCSLIVSSDGIKLKLT